MLDLLAGTVLAGPGDVISFTGDSDAGGTVTLAAVGRPACSRGPSRRRASARSCPAASPVKSPPSRQVEVAPIPSPSHRRHLQDMFANVVIDNPDTPAPLTVPAAIPAGAGATEADCNGSLSPGSVPNVAFENWAGTVDFDLSSGDARMVLTVDAVVTWDMPAVAVTCEYDVPEWLVALIPPATVDLGLKIEVSISANVDSGLTTTIPLSIGFQVENFIPLPLITADVDGTAEQHDDPSVSVTASLGIIGSTKVKILGVAGVGIGVGPEISLSVAAGCTELKGGLVVSVSAEIAVGASVGTSPSPSSISSSSRSTRKAAAAWPGPGRSR